MSAVLSRVLVAALHSSQAGDQRGSGAAHRRAAKRSGHESVRLRDEVGGGEGVGQVREEVGGRGNNSHHDSHIAIGEEGRGR